MTPTTHAEGYLSHYHGGSSRYLSDYSGGSYYAGSRGSSWYYGGANTPIERKHGNTHRQYLRAKHRQAPQPLITLHAYNTDAMRHYTQYWGPPPTGWGFTRASYNGTTMSTQTTRYDPRIHGDR